MSFQKCRKCDRPATHKITRIIDGEATDLFFCQEHAGEFSPLQQASAPGNVNLTQLLAGLLKEEQGQKAHDAGAGELNCESCGLTFPKYRQTMLLGCSDCYQAFARPLAHDLRRYHGTVRHIGKHPDPISPQDGLEKQRATLEKRLGLAIEDEDFELAAQLRDQIRQLKSASSS